MLRYFNFPQLDFALLYVLLFYLALMLQALFYVALFNVRFHCFLLLFIKLLYRKYLNNVKFYAPKFFIFLQLLSFAKVYIPNFTGLWPQDPKGFVIWESLCRQNSNVLKFDLVVKAYVRNFFLWNLKILLVTLQVTRKIINQREICGKFPTPCIIHCNFLNRNCYYSVNIVPDIVTIFRNLNTQFDTHYEDIFDTKLDEDSFLIVLKSNFVCRLG